MYLTISTYFLLVRDAGRQRDLRMEKTVFEIRETRTAVHCLSLTFSADEAEDETSPILLVQNKTPNVQNTQQNLPCRTFLLTLFVMPHGSTHESQVTQVEVHFYIIRASKKLSFRKEEETEKSHASLEHALHIHWKNLWPRSATNKIYNRVAARHNRVFSPGWLDS